ncbi:hypothetical protein SS1G_01212 [Sclerotinia sclerotiorum 1980 UF-70]|uniref:Uncharacterized protein n=2 Tax=Sclerotinia sclerotiorum (strain ATCC 18683 / 1980 / Ss-1) TaxID=665079 RepID=A0A1D9PUD8_SCLS1|nr:hypothetical protein SS1G_01212 [Sclerotinia sclerotiorum 1980 UF-70]APA06280.1 hypothetical protein sscle_01g010500 [Sclerotinia sclerotiorum 1980 UF-70]EDN96286.1 hypothetical protein SS1G_01212 [Sclerotinia sclerotiorum 1980 UF-70]
MRYQSSFLAFSLITTNAALQIPSLLSPPEPFYAPLSLNLDISSEASLISNETILPDTSPASSKPKPELLKRNGNCPSNYNSCSTLNAADGGACCPASATCSTDASHNIACCAIGASCTGTVTTPGATPASVSATVTGTFVPNAYFPFPILPTNYVNSAACSSATDACAKNYAICTVDLQGGMGGAITISAPNGGVTVAASVPTGGYLGEASAASVCQSLSSVACAAVESGGCARYGTGTATTTAGFVIGTNGVGAMIPRPTMMNCLPYAAAAAGVMGLVI